jgi:hypothetical protein
MTTVYLDDITLHTADYMNHVVVQFAPRVFDRFDCVAFSAHNECTFDKNETFYLKDRSGVLHKFIGIKEVADERN